MNKIFKFAAIAAGFVSHASNAYAASGEMGTGIPVFGIYSAATGIQANVWRLESPSMPFPSGCTVVILTPGTMGMDSYKMAVAVLLTARATGRPVRFYANGVRDGGCGVDYVELQ